MVKIIRSTSRLYRSPEIKSKTKRRSRVFETIPIISDEKKEKQIGYYDRIWEMQFFELKKFKKKNGHCNIPGTHNNKHPLYTLSRWAKRQRLHYREKNLMDERIAKLNSIGFKWINPVKIGDSRRINDEDLLDELRRLYSINHRLPKYTDIKKYGKYSHQAYCDHFGSIVKARQAAGITPLKINKSEFDCHDEHWEMQYLELKKYKKKYGSCDVTKAPMGTKYYTLSKWCTTQRTEWRYNPQKYFPYRKKKLDALGFCWDIKDKWFESKLRQLKQYREKHGHCHVSQSHTKNKYYSLARWCNTQRVQRKRNPQEYPSDRLKELNALGFSWNILDSRFKSNFYQLKQYKEKHGHCNVSKTEDKILADWCSNLRRSRQNKSSKLTKEMISRLTELGFEWYETKKGKYELRWEEKFTWLKEYKEKHGHCNVSRIHDTKNPRYPLSQWVIVQRRDYCNKRKGLTTERIRRLNAIGFKWINPIKMGDARRINKDDLLNELHRIYTILGKPPTAEEIGKYGKYTRKPYYTRFGNMANVYKAAGIDNP